MRVIGGNGCFSLNAVTNLPCILPQERIHLLISYRKNRTQIRGSSELCVKQSCRHYSASREETAPGARLTVRSNRKGVFSRRCMVEPILPITQSSEEPD